MGGGLATRLYTSLDLTALQRLSFTASSTSPGAPPAPSTLWSGAPVRCFDLLPQSPGTRRDNRPGSMLDGSPRCIHGLQGSET